MRCGSTLVLATAVRFAAPALTAARERASVDVLEMCTLLRMMLPSGALCTYDLSHTIDLPRHLAQWVLLRDNSFDEAQTGSVCLDTRWYASGIKCPEYSIPEAHVLLQWP